MKPKETKTKKMEPNMCKWFLPQFKILRIPLLHQMLTFDNLSNIINLNALLERPLDSITIEKDCNNFPAKEFAAYHITFL